MVVFRKYWAVIGFDYESGCALMDKIEQTCGKEVAHKCRQQEHIAFTEFTDGTVLSWVPDECSCVKRVGRLWCNKKKDERMIDRAVRNFYMGKYEDIIWV